MKSKRRKQGAFSLPAIRRREIERHALHVGAADTEDLWRWLVAWCWHNDQNARDPVVRCSWHPSAWVAPSLRPRP